MRDNLVDIARSTKYPLEAFLFVQRGLDATVRDMYGLPKRQTPSDSRHIRGQDLCHGLRDYAIKQYGLMARFVLRNWNVNTCEDFGQIVFALIDAGLMHKTEEDSLSDFKGVFDFQEAFSCEVQLS